MTDTPRSRVRRWLVLPLPGSAVAVVRRRSRVPGCSAGSSSDRPTSSLDTASAPRSRTAAATGHKCLRRGSEPQVGLGLLSFHTSSACGLISAAGRGTRREDTYRKFRAKGPFTSGLADLYLGLRARSCIWPPLPAHPAELRARIDRCRLALSSARSFAASKANDLAGSPCGNSLEGAPSGGVPSHGKEQST
jgi:hypothetical protein